MDLDDLLDAESADVTSKRFSKSRWFQRAGRLLFGGIGIVLGGAGAWAMLTRPPSGGTPLMQMAMASACAFLACASAANVMFARRWRWPIVGLVFSLVGLFAAAVAR